MARLFIFIFLLFNAGLFAQSPQELIREANDAYTRSEYSHAIELYEQVLERGLQGPELYYNLGNAYFKNNRLGKAILNYERAARLNPTDENILHNLQIANSRTVDRIEQRPLLFYEQWWRSTYSLFTSTGWAVAGIILFSLFLAGVALYLFSRTRGVKRTAFYLSFLLMGLTAFSLVFAQKQYSRLLSEKEAIIMSPRVAAKSSPSQQSPDLFLMHEGTRVFIRNSLGEWLEISLPNGNVGWVKKEALEVI